MVEEAIKAELCREIYTTDESYQGFPKVETVTDAVMNKLTEVENPQGILAVCQRPKTTQISDKILLLDGVSDPGNLGTLMRSALAFGFQTLVLDDCVDFTNSKVLRSTQGAVFGLNLIETSLPEFIQSHRTHVFFGTDLHGGSGLEGLDFVPEKCGLILGNEARGVRPEVLALTDKNLVIQIGEIESLNVAVAGGILMYWLR
jgi:TrmH family RNA methyltransferase